MKNIRDIRKYALDIFEQHLELSSDEIINLARRPYFFDSKLKVFGGVYENFYPNQLYGASTIIRYFYSLGADPLPIIFPHGIVDTSPVWSLETKSGFPIACYSDYVMINHAMAANKMKKPHFLFLHKSPFEILKDIFFDKKIYSLNTRNSSSNKKILFFPDHSTGRVMVKMSNLKRLDKVFDVLRSDYDEINACIYYIDYERMIQDGTWSEFSKKFDNIFCCGFRYDPIFMIKLFHLLNSHSAVYFDFFGSTVYYSEIMKKRILYSKISRDFDLSMISSLGMSPEEYKSRQKIDLINKIERDRILVSKNKILDISGHRQLVRQITGDCRVENFHLILNKITSNRTKDIALKPEVYKSIHPIIEDVGYLDKALEYEVSYALKNLYGY